MSWLEEPRSDLLILNNFAGWEFLSFVVQPFVAGLLGSTPELGCFSSCASEGVVGAKRDLRFRMISEPLLVKPEEDLDLSRVLKLLAELVVRETPS